MAAPRGRRRRRCQGYLVQSMLNTDSYVQDVLKICQSMFSKWPPIRVSKEEGFSQGRKMPDYLPILPARDLVLQDLALNGILTHSKHGCFSGKIDLVLNGESPLRTRSLFLVKRPCGGGHLSRISNLRDYGCAHGLWRIHIPTYPWVIHISIYFWLKYPGGRGI